MGCNSCGNVSILCAEKTPAPCIFWEIPVAHQPRFGDLDCDSLNDILNEISNDLDEIDTAIDISGLTTCLDGTGITGVNHTVSPPTIESVLQVHEDAICELETLVESWEICNLLDKDITACGFDMSCLTVTDPASCPSGERAPETLKELIQALIDLVCAP